MDAMSAEQATAAGEAVPDAIAELRALADVVLDRIEPWLRLEAAPTEKLAGGTACEWCPLCALVAALRGERPELSHKLAEQGVGWLAAVRALLDTHDEACSATNPAPAEPVVVPRVQRIHVRSSATAP